MSDRTETEKLVQRMRLTRGSRFNYSNRLKEKARYKNITVNFLLIFTIVMGIYALAYSGEMDSDVARFVGVFIIGVSVVSMFISLHESIGELSKKSIDSHRCGLEITNVLRRFQAGKIDLHQATDEYEAVIRNYDFNHGDCDYRTTAWSFRKELGMADHASSATLLNGKVASAISKISPIIESVIGLIIVFSVWKLIPLFNIFIKGGD